MGEYWETYNINIPKKQFKKRNIVHRRYDLFYNNAPINNAFNLTRKEMNIFIDNLKKKELINPVYLSWNFSKVN